MKGSELRHARAALHPRCVLVLELRVRGPRLREARAVVAEPRLPAHSPKEPGDHQALVDGCMLQTFVAMLKFVRLDGEVTCFPVLTDVFNVSLLIKG